MVFDRDNSVTVPCNKKTDVIHYQCQCQCMLLSGINTQSVHGKFCGTVCSWAKANLPQQVMGLAVAGSFYHKKSRPRNSKTPLIRCWASTRVPYSKLPTWRLLRSVRSPPSRAAFAHSRLMPSQLLSIASSPPPPRPHLLNSSTRSSVPPLPPSGCGSSRVSKPSLIMPPSATPRRFAICWRNSTALLWLGRLCAYCCGGSSCPFSGIASNPVILPTFTR